MTAGACWWWSRSTRRRRAVRSGLVVDSACYLEGGGDLGDPRAVVVNLLPQHPLPQPRLLRVASGQRARPAGDPLRRTSEGCRSRTGAPRPAEAGIATVDAAEMRVRRRELDLPHPDAPPAPADARGRQDRRTPSPSRWCGVKTVRRGCRPAHATSSWRRWCSWGPAPTALPPARAGRVPRVAAPSCGCSW